MNHIKKFTFCDCRSLVNISLEHVVRINEGAFADCVNLTEVQLGRLQSIGPYAFTKTGLTRVSLGGGLVDIGEQAFCGCIALTQVDLSVSLRSIQEFAFSECGLLELEAPPGAALDIIEQSAFEACEALATVDLRNAVLLERMTDSVFMDCRALTTLHLPPNLRRIDHAAFNQSGLVSVELPASLKRLGHRAFANCTDLKRADLSKCTRLRLARAGVGKGVFVGCDQLSEVVLPRGMGSTEHLHALGLNGFTLSHRGESDLVFQRK